MNEDKVSITGAALTFVVAGFVSACSSSDDGIEQAEQPSICGPTADFQDVETYDGTYGPSIPFVNAHERPVGQLQWKNDLASRWADPGTVGGKRVCSGTLIAPQLFLTAGQCFDTVDHGSVIFPKDEFGVNITPQKAAKEQVVNFNFQRDPAGNVRPDDVYNIVELLEYRNGDVDYALVLLADFAGQKYGLSPVNTYAGSAGEALAMIGHPGGEPKRLSAGTIQSTPGLEIHYADLDTLGGSSGAGILSTSRNALIGVHTNSGPPGTGCDPQGGFNWGASLSAIVPQSPELKKLLTQKSAFLWAHNATATGTYNAAGSFARAFVGLEALAVTNTVTHIDTGRYDAVFPDVGELPANIQVTAHGNGPERCKVASFAAAGSMRVRVHCHNPAGALTDSQFLVSYVKAPLADGPAHGAYVFSTGASQIDIGRQWNSTGAVNTLEHPATGEYRVTLPGQGSTPRSGNVLVTAYGKGNEYCNVVGWTPSGADLNVDVKCFAPAGIPVDTAFMLTFNIDLTLAGLSGGYAIADDPSAASYTPSKQFAFLGGEGSVISTPIKAARSAIGKYFVTYPLNFLGSTTQVTALTSGSEYCKVASWGPFPGGPGGSKVFVNCFDAAGNPADVSFVSSYSSDQFILN